MSRTGSKGLVLTAMIFAVAMTFIDQTIVSIAVPDIQRELSLSSTGIQWAVNAYLLALASFFAFGGRLADTAGHRRMTVIGVTLVTSMHSQVTTSLEAQGVPARQAGQAADQIAQGHNSGPVGAIPLVIRHDFAAATRTVLTIMAAVMAAAAVVALAGLKRGVQQDLVAAERTDDA